MSLALCSNCGLEVTYARRRCEPCYRYLIRTKKERPPKVQEAIYERRYLRFIAKSLTLGL